MNYQVKDGDTWASIAKLTIGGTAYAPALASMNDWPIGTMAEDNSGNQFSVTPDTTNVFMLRDTIVIPDEWLASNAVPTKSNAPLILLGAAVVGYALWDSGKLKF